MKALLQRLVRPIHHSETAERLPDSTWVDTEEASRLGYLWCLAYGCVCCFSGDKAKAEAAGWNFEGENAVWIDRPLLKVPGGMPTMRHHGRCPEHVWAWDVRDGKYDTSAALAELGER